MKNLGKILIILFLASNLFAIDTVSVRTIGNGVTYIHLRTNEPNNIYIIKIDLKEKNKIKLKIANERIGNKGATVNEMSRELSKSEYVFAGVNGDFFGGSPYQFENSMIIDGEFAKGVNIGRSLFAFTQQTSMYIDTIKFTGYIKINNELLKINSINSNKHNYNRLFNKYFNLNTEINDNEVGLLIKPVNNIAINEEQKFVIVKKFEKTIPKFLYSDRYLAILEKEKIPNTYYNENDTITVFLGTTPLIEDIQQMIGGLPKILEDGVIIDDFAGKEGINNAGFFGKNPRTAIGFDKEQIIIYVVAVDGRDNINSVGFTLPELSKFMKELGCYEALNFDGGGSTTMVLRDSTVNKPTDLTGERPVHNALFVCAEDINPDIFTSLDVICDKKLIYKNESVDIKIEGKDIWGFKSSLSSEQINFEYDNEMCTIKENKIKALKEGEVIIKWSLGKFYGEINLTIE